MSRRADASTSILRTVPTVAPLVRPGAVRLDCSVRKTPSAAGRATVLGDAKKISVSANAGRFIASLDLDLDSRTIPIDASGLQTAAGLRVRC